MSTMSSNDVTDAVIQTFHDNLMLYIRQNNRARMSAYSDIVDKKYLLNGMMPDRLCCGNPQCYNFDKFRNVMYYNYMCYNPMCNPFCTNFKCDNFGFIVRHNKSHICHNFYCQNFINSDHPNLKRIHYEYCYREYTRLGCLHRHKNYIAANMYSEGAAANMYSEGAAAQRSEGEPIRRRHVVVKNPMNATYERERSRSPERSRSRRERSRSPERSRSRRERSRSPERSRSRSRRERSRSPERSHSRSRRERSRSRSPEPYRSSRRERERSRSPERSRSSPDEFDYSILTNALAETIRYMIANRGSLAFTDEQPGSVGEQLSSTDEQPGHVGEQPHSTNGKWF